MKKNIAIIMGGYSSEAEISLKSGAVVYENISKDKYNTYKVHILKNKWVVVDDNNNEFSINKNGFSANIDGKQLKFDCIFNAIHGHPGEDGTILAYFDLIGLKHTSAPFYQMALAFNKRDSLSVVKHAGIKTATSVYIDKGDWQKEYSIVVTPTIIIFVNGKETKRYQGNIAIWNRVQS